MRGHGAFLPAADAVVIREFLFAGRTFVAGDEREHLRQIGRAHV